MATKKPSVATIVLPPDDDFEQALDDFVPIVVEEVKGTELIKVTPKKDFRIRIGKTQFFFVKDKAQYVNVHEEKIIRKDVSRLY